MRKNNFFKSSRWDAGVGNLLELQLAKNAGTGPDDGNGGAAEITLEAVLEPVANLALTYYDRRIRAYFARGGIDIGDDVLTVESIKDKVQAASGLEIEELTKQGIMDALEKPLAKALSDLLGFAVDKVFDKLELRRQVKAHVLERLQDGKGGGVLSNANLHRLRQFATYSKSGVSRATYRQIMNRIYQKRFRRTHKAVWV